MEDITIESLMQELPKHFDDPNYLSRAAVDLARLGFYENTLLAKAELKERRAFLDAKKEEEKVSVAEAEAVAVVITENEYGKRKLDRESLDQLINSVKIRIRVLVGEKDSSRME